MSYIIKKFETFINESKNKKELQWSNFFLRFLSRIDEPEDRKGIRKKFNKFIQILSKDVFSKANILDETDKKRFSNADTETRFSLLMDEKYSVRMFFMYNDDLGVIVDYLNDSNTTINDISTLTYSELLTKSNEYHDNMESTFVINRTDETEETDKFITYPDGWYWINLNVSHSADEATNMGHCGKDPGKILFSLRDDKKQSHVTVSYDPALKSIYQIKGRKNTKPKEIYHTKIVDMLLNDKYVINLINTGAYKPELDFSLNDLNSDEKERIFEIKPTFKYNKEMFEEYMRNNDFVNIFAMFNNGFNDTTYYTLDKVEDITELFQALGKQGYLKESNKELLTRIVTRMCSISFRTFRHLDVNYFRYLDVNEVFKYSKAYEIKDEEELGVLISVGYYINITDVKELCRYGEYKKAAMFLKKKRMDIVDKPILSDIISHLPYSIPDIDIKIKLSVYDLIRNKSGANFMHNFIKYSDIILPHIDISYNSILELLTSHIYNSNAREILELIDSKKKLDLIRVISNRLEYESSVLEYNICDLICAIREPKFGFDLVISSHIETDNIYIMIQKYIEIHKYNMKDIYTIFTKCVEDELNVKEIKDLFSNDTIKEIILSSCSPDLKKKLI